MAAATAVPGAASNIEQACMQLSRLAIADGEHLVVGAGSRVIVYDLDGTPINTLKGHQVCFLVVYVCACYGLTRLVTYHEHTICIDAT